MFGIEAMSDAVVPCVTCWVCSKRGTVIDHAIALVRNDASIYQRTRPARPSTHLLVPTTALYSAIRRIAADSAQR